MSERPRGDSGPEGLTEAEQAEVRSTVEGWTASLGSDWDVWSAYYHPDAVLMAPDQPRIVGRDAIERFIRAGFGDVERMSHANWAIDGSGDLAVVNNDVIWRLVGDAQDSTAKQIVVLRRSAGGRWLVHQVCFNAPGG